MVILGDVSISIDSALSDKRIFRCMRACVCVQARREGSSQGVRWPGARFRGRDPGRTNFGIFLSFKRFHTKNKKFFQFWGNWKRASEFLTGKVTNFSRKLAKKGKIVHFLKNWRFLARGLRLGLWVDNPGARLGSLRPCVFLCVVCVCLCMFEANLCAFP